MMVNITDTTWYFFVTYALTEDSVNKLQYEKTKINERGLI